MNTKNINSQKTLKISNWGDIPNDYTGIIEWLDGDKRWYLNGELHRVDGPAVERSNGDKWWYLNGKLHRTDGPAVEFANGHKEWWINDLLHRVDGPAVEQVFSYKEWWLNGLLHRTDGPAVESWDGSKEWWLNGILVNPLFFEIPGCEKYVDYYITILQTELVEHEKFLLKELKNHIESEIKSK